MKKEPLSLIAVKTLLAVIIFTGVGTIIVGSIYLKNRHPVLQIYPAPATPGLTGGGRNSFLEAPLPSTPLSPTETLIKSVAIEENKTVVTTEDYKITKLLSTGKSNFDDTISKRITVDILNYSIGKDGLISIKGVGQKASLGEPILPYLPMLDVQAVPDKAKVEVNFNEESSSYVVIEHKIPLGTIGGPFGAIKNEKFSYKGFYPTPSYWTNSVFGLGGDYKNYFLGAMLAQYNPETKETKIWTKMTFDVQYHLSSVDFTEVVLSTDKREYNSNEKIKLTVSLKNKKHTRAVDLSLLLRDFITGEEIITMEEFGSMGISGMENEISAGTYTIDLQKIPRRLIENKIIQAELIICDPGSGEALSSGVIFFRVNETTGAEIKKIGISNSWRTYRNKDYGYEIDYPEDWSYKEGIRQPQNFGMMISFSDSQEKHILTIDHPIREIGYQGWIETKTEKIKIQNSDKYLTKRILLTEGEDPRDVNLVLATWGENDDWQRSGQITFGYKDENDSNLKVLNQILSTFKFIEK